MHFKNQHRKSFLFSNENQNIRLTSFLARHDYMNVNNHITIIELKLFDATILNVKNRTTRINWLKFYELEEDKVIVCL